jgi:hypothetical protein
VTVRHTFKAEGIYTIAAYAEDIHGATGPVSTIPYIRIKGINPFFYNLLDYFYQLKPYFIKSCQFSKN